MTHEDPQRSYTEHREGPEHDVSLPEATSIPETTDVERSLAPPMHDVTGLDKAQPEYVGAEPGWWSDDARHFARPHEAAGSGPMPGIYPRWSGPTENEV